MRGRDNHARFNDACAQPVFAPNDLAEKLRNEMKNARLMDQILRARVSFHCEITAGSPKIIYQMLFLSAW